MSADEIDPLCGKPWSEHTRIGDCPQSALDNRSWPMRLMLLGSWAVAALMVWAACSGR